MRIINRVADFVSENDKPHYLFFFGKVFKIDLSTPQAYDEPRAYGLLLGIPEYQLDFSADIQ